MTDELSGDARSILEQALAEERSLAPGPRQRAGLKQALLQGAAVAGMAGATAKASALQAARAAVTGAGVPAAGLAVLSKGVGLGLLISGALLGSFELASRARGSSEPPPAKAAVVAPAARPSLVVLPQGAAAPLKADTIPKAPAPASAAPVVVPLLSAASAPPSLRAEVELLSAAQSALRDGRAAEALALLERYDVAFPAGQLTGERLAAEVFAACQLGESARSSRAAKRFLLRDTDSALAERVKRACPFANGGDAR